MDKKFPQRQDEHPLHTFRSQTLYPLSYGCVWGRLYLFRGQKSRNGSGGGVFCDVSIVSRCTLGATNNLDACRLTDGQGFFWGFILSCVYQMYIENVGESLLEC